MGVALWHGRRPAGSLVCRSEALLRGRGWRLLVAVGACWSLVAAILLSGAARVAPIARFLLRRSPLAMMR